MRRKRNQRRGPERRTATPDGAVMLVVISPSIMTSSKWIYLLIDDDGKIADAWIVEAETFPEAASKYKSIPSIDIDVTAKQYRQMMKFAKQLKKLRKVSPKLQRERKAANPNELKKRVMR